MSTEVLQLRAHHICCMRFVKVTFEERGPEFRRVMDKIKDTFVSQPESLVMAIEGGDELCQVCFLYTDGRCSSPSGDENEVRKMDAIVLKELDLSCGDCLTAGQWQARIEQKTPLKLCQRCPWKEACSIGAGF